MILRFLCTLFFLTIIGCYSVSEEEVEPDEPPIFQQAAAFKQEKSLDLNSLKSDLPSDNDEASPYNDETPVKAVKYKNYGYFHPSVATLKISRQSTKPAALQAAFDPASGFQFKTDRNIAALMGSNGTLEGKPKFHYQRRVDENQQQLEFEEIDDDSVNVRNRKVRPNSYTSSPRSYENHRKPNHYVNVDDTRMVSGQRQSIPKRRLSLRFSPARSGGSRRSYQRNLKTTDETPGELVDINSFKLSLSEGSDLKAVGETDESSTNDELKTTDEDFGKKMSPVKNSIDRSDSGLSSVGSQGVFVDDIVGEGGESNRAATDIDLDREYRKLPPTRSSAARGRVRRRHKVERSLADPEPTESESASSGFFIPTPIPGFLYPKSAEIVENSTGSSANKASDVHGASSTESVSHMSTYFLPTRPAGAFSEEVQSITDGLSSYYTVGNATEHPGSSSKRPPMVFVTAVNEFTDRPGQNGPSRPDNPEVEQEINEKKNFSIEDFYNAFSANVTEYPNRHRDPEEGSSITFAVNSASSGSFLAFAPHFPSLSVSDLQSSRAIKYPCTCDKGKCGCCTGRIMSNFNINIPARGCLNITYIPEDFEFNVKMTYNDRTLAQRRVSGKNPRPMCVPLPRLTGRAQACVKLSNVYLVGRNVHMCLDLEAKVQNEELFKVSFDCVRMGTSGIKWIKPEDGGGLGPPPVVEGPTPDDYDSVVASEGDDISSAKGSKQTTNKESGKPVKDAKPSGPDSRPVKDASKVKKQKGTLDKGAKRPTKEGNDQSNKKKKEEESEEETEELFEVDEY